MSRRGSKIDRSRVEKAAANESFHPKSPKPTRPRMMKDKESVSSRRLRAQTPPPGGRGRGAQTSQLLRASRSGRGQSSERNIDTPWTTTPVTVSTSADMDGGSESIPTLPSRDVSSGWTTASGNFDPNACMSGFDAKSNVGLHGAVVHSSSSLRSGQFDEDYSDSSPLSFDVPDNFASKPENSVEEPIEDPVERNRFYKNLKKRGIRKTLTVDFDWETDSARTAISEMSISNASYILDLAQQKESRKKDREEEALEEALDLYGTWLQEGKSDDKNIFLMILHEVKKEVTTKYANADKQQDAMLNTALDEEIERRERIQEEKKKAETKSNEAIDETANVVAVESKVQQPSVNPKIRQDCLPSEPHKKNDYAKRSVRKIDQILERNASKQNLNAESIEVGSKTITSEEYEDTESEDKHFPEEWNEPYTVSEHERGQSCKRKHKLRGVFKRLGSTRKLRGDASIRSAPLNALSDHTTHTTHTTKSGKESRTERRGRRSVPVVEDHETDPILNVQKLPNEDSNNMFSRLRIKLSEKRDNERKEEESWWKKHNHVETKEEQWWKKINDAQKEEKLFVSQGQLNVDSTSKSIADTHELVGGEEMKKDGGVKRRFSKRRESSKATVEELNDFLDQESVNKDSDEKSKEKEEFLSPTKAEKKKKKKKATDSVDEDDDSESHPKSPQKVRKKKSAEKKKKMLENANKENTDYHVITPESDRQTSKVGDGFPSVPDIDDALKSPKSKDKKKKKKTKSENMKRDGLLVKSQSFKGRRKSEKLTERPSSCRNLDLSGEVEVKTSKKTKSKRVDEEVSDMPVLDEAESNGSKAKKKKSKSNSNTDLKSPGKPSKKKKKAKSEGRSASPTRSEDPVFGDIRFARNN